MGAKNYANVLQILILKYSCGPEKLLGLSRNRPLDRVVLKPINANPGLNVVQGFCFSCLKAFPVLILQDNLKTAKVKFFQRK